MIRASAEMAVKKIEATRGIGRVVEHVADNGSPAFQFPCRAGDPAVVPVGGLLLLEGAGKALGDDCPIVLRSEAAGPPPAYTFRNARRLRMQEGADAVEEDERENAVHDHIVFR